MAEPLDRFPLFRASGPDELFQFGSTHLGASRIEIKNLANFEAHVNLVQLKGIGIGYAATTCDLAADHGESDCIKVQFAIRGRGRIRSLNRETDLDQRQTGITPSGMSTHSACQAGHARLTLRLDPKALQQKLEALLGGKPKGQLTFHSAIDMRSPHAQRLLQLVNFLTEQVNAVPPLSQEVGRELEQAAAVASLFAKQRTLTARLLCDHLEPSSPAGL